MAVLMQPKKRSFQIAGHRTSISLEQPFWEALKELAVRDEIALSELVGRIDRVRGKTNLSSAVRVYILAQYRSPAPPSSSLSTGEGQTPPV